MTVCGPSSCRSRKAPHPRHRHFPKSFVPGTVYLDPSVSAANSPCAALVVIALGRPPRCSAEVSSVAFRRRQPQASEQQFQGEPAMKKRSVFFSLLAAATAVAMPPALADEEGTILALGDSVAFGYITRAGFQ